MELSDFLNEFSDKDNIDPFLETICHHAQLKNSGASIKALKCDKSNHLWIGFDNNGLGKIGLDNFKLETFNENGPIQRRLSSNKVLSLCLVENKMFVGTVDGGVNLLELSNGVVLFIKSKVKNNFNL
jgi:hypothetical protein